MEKKTVEYIYTTTVQVNDDHIVRRVESLDDRRERVVRCRDCKHAITSYRDGLPRCAGPLVMEATLVSPDGFCAWGEPREED